MREDKSLLKVNILAATRNGVTVRFNNVNGEPSTAAKALRDEVYNSMVNDSRVRQALDPWWLKSKVPEKLYDYQNAWQEVNNTYLTPQDISLAEFDQMSQTERLNYLDGDTGEGRERLNMLLHRHHLHITIFNY